MKNNKFLYGLVLGLLSVKLYPNLKKKVRPFTVKAIEGAITISNNTKNFVDEVTKEAVDQREEKYKKLREENSSLDLELLEKERNNILNRIMELKNKLGEESKKIGGF